MRALMEKTAAVEMLGQDALLRPTWITLALKANDRLKLHLTVLQAAAAHARQPERAIADLRRDIDAAGIPPGDLASWLRDLPSQTELHGQGMELPGWPRLAALLRDDLHAMAPCIAGAGGAGARGEQVRRPCRALGCLALGPDDQCPGLG